MAYGACSMAIEYGVNTIDCTVGPCTFIMGRPMLSCSNVTCKGTGTDLALLSLVRSLQGQVEIGCQDSPNSTSSLGGRGELAMCGVDVASIAVPILATCAVSACGVMVS